MWNGGMNWNKTSGNYTEKFAIEVIFMFLIFRQCPNMIIYYETSFYTIGITPRLLTELRSKSVIF